MVGWLHKWLHCLPPTRPSFLLSKLVVSLSLEAENAFPTSATKSGEDESLVGSKFGVANIVLSS